MTKHKCVLLYSGGLDSILAAKVLQEQNIEVIGFHCILPFMPDDFNTDDLAPVKQAKQIDLPLVIYKCGHEYMEMVKSPPHGHGKNMNPCIDCKIFFIKKAAEYMHECGAAFVATGEVVGQRPMSQLKHTLNHIINVTHLEGRLLRPLSAKILKPTLVEEQGIVDRDKLLDISGRGRRIQMQLAEKYGITDYASPAGGCLLTDANVSARLRDLFAYHENYTHIDTYLLTIGRHFRLDDKAKLIVARNEFESIALENCKASAQTFFEPTFKGPTAYLCGEPTKDITELAVSIVCRYGKPDLIENKVIVSQKNAQVNEVIVKEPASEELLNQLRI